MARTHRVQRHVRLDVLTESVAAAAPPVDASPTLLELLEARHDDPVERARAAGWLVAALDPDDPDAASACCETHGARRAYLWVTREALTLDEVEQEARACPEPRPRSRGEGNLGQQTAHDSRERD